MQPLGGSDRPAIFVLPVFDELLQRMSTPNRILLLTTEFPPEDGGLQRTAERLATAAIALGVKVTVVAPAADGDAEYDRSCSFHVLRYRKTTRLKTLIALWRATRRALRDGPLDHVIAMTWNPSGVTAVAMRTLGMRVPVTILAHGLEIAAQAGPVRLGVLRLVLSRAHLAVNSRFTNGLLRARGVDHARVVNPGADVISSSSSDATKAVVPTVLSVGRLIKRKGFDRLIEAVPLLVRRIPNVRLVIVGDGPDRVELQQRARALGVLANVEFTGRASDEVLAEKYAEAWCFAMPNRNEGTDVEGFGLVFLEAAHHGLACIGGKDSGAEDAIVHGETGFVVDGTDVAAIAGAIETLLTDRSLAEAMGAAALARARSHFTWSRYLQELLSPVRQ